MKQYCRYCAFACPHDDDWIWCTEKKKFRSGSQVTSPNNCPQFSFCSIDALNPDHEYTPRKEKEKPVEVAEDNVTENQISLF